MFIPGPVDVDQEVLIAQARPMLPHRSIEFEEIFVRAADKSRILFFTQNRVFITASSGTGLQEAAVRNLAKTQVLSCVNGAFGNRWYEVAISNGKSADKIEQPWDQPILPELVYDVLKRKPYELVSIVHNETSTGMQNPVQEIAAAVHSASPDTLIAVDAVSSLGGTKIETDVWELDVVLTSSQKCLAIPPGLGLAAVSNRALEYASRVPNRGWYFDFLLLEKHRLKDSTPATPAISLVYALDVQLDRILSEGLEERFNRHASMAQQVRAWALHRQFGIFAPEGYRSNTVTAVMNPWQVDVADLNAYLKQYEMRIANGYGPLKGKTFRIAHMGETQVSHIQALLEFIDKYLDQSSRRY